MESNFCNDSDSICIFTVGIRWNPYLNAEVFKDSILAQTIYSFNLMGLIFIVTIKMESIIFQSCKNAVDMNI